MTFVQRRARARQTLARMGLDALLVTDLVNVRYLTGFTGSYGEALLTTDPAGDVVVTDGRYAEQITAEVSGITVAVLPPETWLADRLPREARLGVEDRTIPWARVAELQQSLDVELVRASGLIEDLRQTKDDREVAALSRACLIADEAFKQLTTWAAPGMTEREIAVRLDRTMVDLGAAAASFSTIVAAGPNAARPHHRPTNTVVQRGDLVVVDFGALVDGYHSDMTRVFGVGTVAPKLVAVFDTVFAAQAAGVAAVGAGVESAAVDRACRDVITKEGYGDLFPHGTGHGVGLQIHEQPYLRPLSQGAAAAGPSATLRDRMTVTVEPGIYLRGLGGVRIEDSLMVTAEGARILTMTPKELVIL